MKKIVFCALVALIVCRSWAAEPVPAALYVDRGCRGAGVVQWAELLRDSPDIELKLVSGADIRNGALDDRQLLVMPGGWGGPQYDAMGDAGADRVRAFVANSGKYFGTCCGFSIALNEDPDFGKRLKMLPFRRTPNHTSRGQVFGSVAFNRRGAEWFGIPGGNRRIRFSNGPIVIPTDPVPACSNVEVLATVNYEVACVGEVAKPMHGTPACVRADYGKGEMLVFNCHPEAFPVTRDIVAAGLRALTGRPVRLVPRKAPAKGVERIGYLCDPSFDLSVASVMRYFELRKDPAVEIRPVTRQDLDTGLGELLDRVINAKDE